MPAWRHLEHGPDVGVEYELVGGGHWRAAVAATPVGTIVSLTILSAPDTDDEALDRGKLLAEQLVSRALAGAGS